MLHLQGFTLAGQAGAVYCLKSTSSRHRVTIIFETFTSTFGIVDARLGVGVTAFTRLTCLVFGYATLLRGSLYESAL